MLNTFTVSFFGHRMIDNALKIESRLEQLIRTLLRDHEYVEFLVGRDGEFDQLVSSAIRRCKREYRSDNSAHIWVLPISQPSTGTTKNLSGTTMMKSKSANLLPGATTKMPTRPETGPW